MRALVHHVDLRQIVAQTRLEVVRIVRRRHFHGACAELGIGKFVEDDWNLAIHQRQNDLPAVQMGVALVPGIHCDGSVAEHGLRAGGGNGDELLRAHHRVANLIELAGHILMLDLEVRDRRAAVGTPVHDVLAAIDQSLLIEAHENLAHRAREVLVHGEVFAFPIDGGAEALHLL